MLYSAVKGAISGRIRWPAEAFDRLSGGHHPRASPCAGCLPHSQGFCSGPLPLPRDHRL